MAAKDDYSWLTWAAILAGVALVFRSVTSENEDQAAAEVTRASAALPSLQAPVLDRAGINVGAAPPDAYDQPPGAPVRGLVASIEYDSPTKDTSGGVLTRDPLQPPSSPGYPGHRLPTPPIFLGPPIQEDGGGGKDVVDEKRSDFGPPLFADPWLN